jgi:hypothetical protein
VLLAETDLPVREAGDIALLLLGRDPFEDACEVLVLHDRARVDARMRLGVEAGGERLIRRVVWRVKMRARSSSAWLRPLGKGATWRPSPQ